MKRAIDTLKPTAALFGVSDGGKTDGNVTLKNPSEEVRIEAYLNGERFTYAFGDELTKEGVYRFVLTDKAGNTTEYAFEIAYSVNAAGLAVIYILTGLVICGIGLIVVMRKRKAFKSKPKKTA
ncbi:MAG: hypothetical protein LBP26_05215 [Clostridiales bacterium]|nr:hypothetical protein [Clostridiales bacterium]